LLLLFGDPIPCIPFPLIRGRGGILERGFASLTPQDGIYFTYAVFSSRVKKINVINIRDKVKT